MTRARERLYLSNATLRRMHGTTRYNPPSRFLSEIPAELLVGRPRSPRHEPQRAPQLEPPRGPSGPRSGQPQVDAGPVVDYSEGQFSPDELPPLQPGMRVGHPTFGAGTIVALGGFGRNAKIQVRFDRAGIKTIVIRFAQLRLLS